MYVISPRVPDVHVISLGVPDLNLIFYQFFPGTESTCDITGGTRSTRDITEGTNKRLNFFAFGLFFRSALFGSENPPFSPFYCSFLPFISLFCLCFFSVNGPA